MGLIEHPALGTVHVRVHPAARRFIARWRDGHVHLTVPPGASASDVDCALRELTPRLMSRRSAAESTLPRYCDGYEFATDGWSFRLSHTAALERGKILVQQKKTAGDADMRFVILYGPGIDFDTDSHRRAMSRAITRCAHRFTQLVILPEADRIARSLGLRPAAWKVGRGQRTLGTCRADGQISLSERLAFLPAELRRSTITHELAHLTHMNHSPAFHALWERYMGCPLAPVRARLRAFRWPV